MKMFFAMGITWLAEVVGFAIDWLGQGNAAFGSGNDVVNFCKIVISLQVNLVLCFAVTGRDTLRVVINKKRLCLSWARK